MTLTCDQPAVETPIPERTVTPGGGARAKRLLDVAVSALALGAVWPLLLVIAVAIRLDSPGPVLFRQERVGLKGQVFHIHKFRSMMVVHDGALVSAAGDSRVTRVGRVLRKSKFDELPQLLDVLAGDMSLVGPRPEVPRYAELWPASMRQTILSVRPGITDPVSIELRNEAEELAAATDPHQYYVDSLLPWKAIRYVDYVQTRSFAGDLAIICRTVLAVARG
ncbi:MAG: sugar transferase [Micromonosporaceae bacterium]|nr:sugar transferase [Micromonosporaceae bacterium]